MKRKRILPRLYVLCCFCISLFIPFLGRNKAFAEHDGDQLRQVECARSLITNGEYKRAETSLRSVLSSASAKSISASTRLAALNLLAVVLHKVGQNEGAANALTQALSLIQNEQESEARAKILSNLSSIYGELGNLHDAISCCKESLSILSSKPDTSIEQSTVLNNYGRLLLGANDFDNAYCLFEKCILIREKFFGANSIELLSPLMNLAATEMARKNFSSCELLSKRVLQIVEQEEGKDSALLFPALLNLARIDLQRKDYNRAQVWADRATAIAKVQFGPDSEEAVVACISSAQILHSSGSPLEAEANLRRALSHAESTFGSTDRRAEQLQGALCRLLSRGKLTGSDEGASVLDKDKKDAIHRAQ